MEAIDTGPVDVLMLKFPGNHFDGRIMPAVGDLIDRGLIRVLDLLFVRQEEDETITTLEISQIAPDLDEYVEIFEQIPGGYLDAEDAEQVIPDLEPNSSLALLAVENVWAIPFVDAVRAAQGEVLDQVRIPADVVAEVRRMAKADVIDAGAMEEG